MIFLFLNHIAPFAESGTERIQDVILNAKIMPEYYYTKKCSRVQFLKPFENRPCYSYNANWFESVKCNTLSYCCDYFAECVLYFLATVDFL